MVQKPDRSKGRMCGFQGRVGLSAGAFLVRSPASFFANVMKQGPLRVENRRGIANSTRIAEVGSPPDDRPSEIKRTKPASIPNNTVLEDGLGHGARLKERNVLSINVLLESRLIKTCRRGKDRTR